MAKKKIKKKNTIIEPTENRDSTETTKKVESVTTDSQFGFIMNGVVQSRLTPLILYVLFFLNGLFVALRNSGSCDELGAHIPSGYLYWTTGQFGGGINNPPLGQLIIASLVKLFGLEYTLFSEQHLFLFRLPVLVMGLVLAIFIYKLTASLYDKKTAVLALFFYCFSPNILAHTSLATLDIPIACFVFLTIYFSFTFLNTRSIYAYSLLCLSLAAALTTKIQAILLAPILLILFAVYFRKGVMVPVGNNKDKKKSWDFKKIGIYLLLIGIILLVVINLVYLNFPFGEGKNILPEDFVSSIKEKFQHSEAGHFSYLLGEYSDKGWWYYFPLIILFKTSLVVLFLLLIGIFWKPEKKTVFFLFIPIVVFLGVAMRSHVNIGIRHILIIYPFLFILAAIGAARLLGMNKMKGKNKTVFALMLVLVLGWYVVEAVIITPHQLSYFNILAGGSKNGHHIMVDSNYDWGLNDYYLERYIQEKNLNYKINPDAFVPEAGHILVNVNALYGVLNDGPEAYLWLKEYKPINQIAYTWFEYDVPETDLLKLARFNKPEKHSYNYPDHLKTDVALFQQQFATDLDPEPHLKLALMFIDRWDYRNALKEIRFVLKNDPTNKFALSLGGELIVRFKLGVLIFKDGDYLKFFKENSGPAE